MPEAVEWLADGTPRSPRFQDIYRSHTGALEQADHVFLRGCALPQAWAGQRQWRILETGFGLGLNFLAAWRAWKDDANRPGILHFVSMEAWPVGREDLLRSVRGQAPLAPLADELALQWFGLTPGVHRLSFEQGRVLLTLFIGDVRDALRQQVFRADSVFLDGFEPQRNPAMWEPAMLKAIARHCRRGARVATWTVAAEVRRALAEAGFTVEKAPGLPPKRDCLRGTFDPAWEPRATPAPEDRVPDDCTVIGGGLSGAAAAASLARRGWQVSVLDSAASPAGGASGLPVGLLAPHYSTDDNLLSRLSRGGVRITLQQARTLLRKGSDWCPTGALEVRAADSAGTGESDDAMQPWSRAAGPEQLSAVGMAVDAGGIWHEQAAWIKPSALVRAWLSQPGITWRGNCNAHAVGRDGDAWQVLAPDGAPLARSSLVIVAAAGGSTSLLQERVAIHPVRGQVSWGMQGSAAMPPFALNGNGHFIPGVPTPTGTAWFCGSTFQPGETDLEERAADHAFNFERLRNLAPLAASGLAPLFSRNEAHAWTGVRYAAGDRRPLLGEVEPGLWVSTAMGSRGLTFAALCGELLAARLHSEPFPLERRLAQALDAAR